MRDRNIGLETLLQDGHVVCHPFIIGELACGNLKNRAEILSLLGELPTALNAEHYEVMLFMEKHCLIGKGLGYIDMHLLASAMLTGITLWTLDKRLNEAAAAFKLKPEGVGN